MGGGVACLCPFVVGRTRRESLESVPDSWWISSAICKDSRRFLSFFQVFFIAFLLWPQWALWAWVAASLPSTLRDRRKKKSNKWTHTHARSLTHNHTNKQEVTKDETERIVGLNNRYADRWPLFIAFQPINNWCFLSRITVGNSNELWMNFRQQQQQQQNPSLNPLLTSQSIPVNRASMTGSAAVTDPFLERIHQLKSDWEILSRWQSRKGSAYWIAHFHCLLGRSGRSGPKGLIGCWAGNCFRVDWINPGSVCLPWLNINNIW